MKHTHTINRALACVFLLCAQGHALAIQVTLTQVDGTISVGELVALSPTSIEWQADGRTVSTSLEDLSRITFHTQQAESKSPHPCILYPAAGGKLAATIMEPVADGMIVNSRLGERMNIPFATIKAITIEQRDWPGEVQTRFAETAAKPLIGEDILLAKSDKAAGGVRAIRGTLLELGATGGEFRFNNRTRRIRMDKIYAIILAAPTTKVQTHPSGIELTGGDELAGALASVKDGTLSFETSLNQTVSCNLNDLQTLTLNNDRIVFLDTLPPHSHSSSGMMHDGWPFRTNRNVFNQPMRMDSVEFDRGIGVHARSEILYQLDGKYDTFAVTIGLDDAVRPAGNVRFKILADGADLYDSGPITGSDRAKPIKVSVNGAEWMTLIVETEKQADIGDWANWAAARLIKPKSKS